MAKANETAEQLEEMLDLEGDESETEETVKPITPADIADATGADPKAIRNHLRTNYARPKEMKGKSWDIPPKVAEAVIGHFTPAEEADEEELEEVS